MPLQLFLNIQHIHFHLLISSHNTQHLLRSVNNINLCSHLVDVSCHPSQAMIYVYTRDQRPFSPETVSLVTKQLIRFLISEDFSRYREHEMEIKCLLPESSCARIKKAFLLAKVIHVVPRPRSCKNYTQRAGTRTRKLNIIRHFNYVNEGKFKLRFNSNIIFIDNYNEKWYVVQILFSFLLNQL